MSAGVGKARGVLRHAPATGVFHHARIAAPPELTRVVQHFWSVRWDLQGWAPQVRETVPHPNVHLVIESTGSRIHGIHAGRFTRILQGRGGVFGVKFRPGGFRAFLQRPMSTLRDRSLLPQDVFGEDAAELDAIAQAQPDDARMVALASDFFAAHLPPTDAQALRVGELVDGIAADRRIRMLDDLASRYGTGPRTLQRLFNEYVGIGPKWVIRRYRMHEALERIDAGGAVDWVALALELGYFDQAHFIRDFRTLVGCPPVEYVRRFRSA